IPATSEAQKTLGRVIVANIVMLGALVQVTGIVSRGAMEKAIRDSVPKGTEDLNLRALRRGMELAGGTGGQP
ncbi:MAG: 2-oxoacid:acceptor oxidoreductase family protein, partial [Methanomicrobiales archaeon]|nr:2-oxoacid:acceptor oxidoreductase family protein [Methanomicrobiales archaeon]